MGYEKGMRERLECVGLTFSEIPKGKYFVGADEERDKNYLFAVEPRGWKYHTRFSKWQKVEVEKFFIATEPIRLSHFMIMKEAAKSKLRAVLDELKPGTEYLGKDDPVLDFSFADGCKLAQALRARLPRWYEWEAAFRGTDGRLFPWGGVFNQDKYSASLEYYSVDKESDMGFCKQDQEVAFLKEFRPEANTPSPFGLRGLARCGREWNLCHDDKPCAEDDHILRSLCDLGGMLFMVPGVRPFTYGSEFEERHYLSFSGPALPCYCLEHLLDFTYDGDRRIEREWRYTYASVRLVFGL